MGMPTVYPETAEIASVDSIITKAIDFSVELREMETVDGLAVPGDRWKAGVKIDKDGNEQVISVVGWRYQVIDHRDLIRDFKNTIERADQRIKSVHHRIYWNGARIYSDFALDVELPFGSKMKAIPVLTLSTSHDGSVKLGFKISAYVGGFRYAVNPKLYGVDTKHLRGAKTSYVLSKVHEAVDVFTNEIIPMWVKMNSVSLNSLDVQKMVKKMIEEKIISQRMSKDVDLGKCTLWELYSRVTKVVSKSREGKEEVGEYRAIQSAKFFTECLEKRS